MALSRSPTRAQRTSLVFANLLIPVAVLVFATGFFPCKPFVPGLAEYEETIYGQPPAAQFDKIVFMVVDALRSDFVYGHGSGFKFTQSLIRTGEALPFTAHATSPTITMPRVKAITTGSIPSFLDVILNFAESDTTSSLATQDTWLAQIKDKKRDGKMIMYGDDTWLKLFPNMFDRADGTSSFFVSDFTEVDNNVTRHVPHELRVDDWNTMVMHYLGLDHIGHKAGPLSPNMVPKQQEMDGIVQQIYQAMTSMTHLSNTLLVLCGDHGMNEGGNHGGSAPGETSPALVFISPKLKTLSNGRACPTEPKVDFEYYSMIEQSDVAPTIAGLLGVPIPQNNLGVFIPELLPLWTNPIDQVQLLLRNAKQILKIVKATFSLVHLISDEDELTKDVIEQTDAGDGGKLAQIWLQAIQKLPQKNAMGSNVYQALDALYLFCREAQDIMSSAASNYDLTRLLLGTGIAFASVILAALASPNGSLLLNTDGAFALLLTALYGVMMFASSYVEEEQHFWYWIAGGWIVYLACQRTQRLSNRRMYLVLILALHRIIQRWNQTGQKFAGASDIVQDILRPHPTWLWTLVTATYLVLLYRLGNHIVHELQTGYAFGTACSLALVVPAFLFKLAFTANDAPELLSWLAATRVRSLEHIPLVGSARVVFLTLASESIWAFSAAAHSNQPRVAKGRLPGILMSLLTLFLVTQARTTNIPLFLLFGIQFDLLSRLHLSSMQITITTLVCGQVSFFALGNSNAISSIDLSNAYNGVSGYNILAVGALVFLGNWAGPVWWSLAGVALLVQASSPADSLSVQAEDKAMTRRKWVQMELDNLATKKSEVEDDTTRMPGDALFHTHSMMLTLFTSISLLAIMVACTVLRTHLFIWTVFSPKYLFAMSWTVAFHEMISLAIGSAIWRFCT